MSPGDAVPSAGEFVAGLVVEMGGVLSHGSVVARELHWPPDDYLFHASDMVTGAAGGVYHRA